VEAFEAFIDPFRSALSCLGTAKVTVSPAGRTDRRKLHAWSLNDGQGMRMTGGLLLRATMQYVFLEDQSRENGPWRCSTRGYMYSVYDREDRELIAYHWHPSGASHYKAPHLHVGTPALAPTGVFTAGSHLPTGRVSFESFVRLIITDLKVPPQRETWASDLTLTEGVFEVWRSWSTTPPEIVSSGGH
jgi:hypothetical protein